MSPTSADDHKPSAALSDQRAIISLAAALIPVLTLLVFSLFPQLGETGTTGLWLACLLLNIITGIPDDHYRSSFYHAYRALGVMVSWLTIGISAALLLILTAELLLLTQRVWLRRRQDHLAPLSELRSRTLAGFSQMGVPLAVAALVYRLVNGQIPLHTLSGMTEPALLTMLLAYQITADLTRREIFRWLYRLPFDTIWSVSQRQRLLMELVLLPLIVLLPIIHASVGTGTSVVLVLVLSAFATYQYTLASTAYQNRVMHNQSADLVRKLIMVNRSAQNAMFRVDQDEALLTACQTALNITGANRSALFVVERDTEILNLAESVGITEAEKQAGYNINFPKNNFTEVAPVIRDSAHTPHPDPLTAFNQQLTTTSFVEVPLLSGESILGYLVVYHDRAHTYSSEELELLSILTDRIATALDNTHLLDTLEFHAFEMTHLVHLSRISTASLNLNEVAADVTHVLRQMSAMDWAVIALFQEGSHLMNMVGYSGSPSVREVETFQNQLQQFDEVVAIRNQDVPRIRFLRVDEAGISSGLRTYLEVHGLRSLVIAPMLAHQTTFGVIFLGTTASRVLSEREAQLVEAAANQVATQIYNAQLYNETYNTLRRQLQQIALIRDIVQRISSSRDFNAIIQDVFEAAATTTGADRVSLALLTEANDLWVIEQNYEPRSITRDFYRRRKTDGIFGQVLASGELVSVVKDAVQKSEFPSRLAVPLIWDETVVGVLRIDSRFNQPFTQEQGDFLRNLGIHAIISIQNQRLLGELEYQVDVLTSLRKLSLSLSTVIDTPSVALKVVQAGMEMMRSQYAAIFQLNAMNRPTMLLEQIPEGSTPISRAQFNNVSALAQKVAQSTDIQVIENLNDDDPALPFATLVGIPIKRGVEVYQVLCLGFSEPQAFDNREMNTLTLLGTQTSAHLENAGLHEKIRDVNNRLRAILDSTRDGVILLDERGRIIEVNPAAQRLIGIDLHEHINETLVNVLLQYTEGEEESQAGYSREELLKLARIQRLGPQGITRREFKRKVNPNQMLYIEEIGSPVIDESNHMVGRLMVLRDITEEKRLEEYRNEITGMAVHDLRAPLSAIINALQIASERIENPAGIPVVKRTINMGLTNAEEMLTQVNTLLDIRKGKEMVLERTHTSIEQVIELARLRLTTSAEKAGIHIETEIPSNLPEANIDTNKIGRVLQNLVDNAIRFTPSGEKIRISAEHQPLKNKLVIRVSDSGPGIPEKDQARVFDQYWQSKENRPLRGTKGSGIGLAFCKLVLEAHDERIWIENGADLPGAAFIFTLPTV